VDKGALAIARILIVALVLGVAVILWHPGYRKTLQAVFQGNLTASPIWVSNEKYYPSVDFRMDVKDDVTK